MFKQLFVGLVVSSFSLQAFAQAGAFHPSVGAQFNFGGPEQSRSFKAHLSFSLPALSEVARKNELPQQIQNFRYLSFSSSHTDGSVLHLMGSPVAAWSQPKHTEFVLQQNQQSSSSSSWFGRNWWVVGLGVLAVGAAAAAGGGGGSDNNQSSGGNTTNCGASGTVVGPGGVNVDPNCPPG